MVLSLLSAVFIPMLLEARISARNERAQRARGGIEPAGDVFSIMRLAYPSAFLAIIAEGAWRGGAPPRVLASGAVLFAAAKTLKWWAMATLGRAWTFRVITVPGDGLVTTGPYRRLDHPNYVAVAGELMSVAMMAGAPAAGAVATVGFSLLMRKRIAVEELALGRRHR